MRMHKTLKVLYPDEFGKKQKRPKRPGYFSRKINSAVSFVRGIETPKLLVGASALTLVMVGAYTAYSYNRFTTFKQSIHTAHANIAKEVQRRNDLINNLIPPTLNYLQYEKELFSHVVEIRQELLNREGGPGAEALAGAQPAPETADSPDTSLSRALGAQLPAIMGIFENYPDLKASKPFSALMQELIETENRIADSRKAFNEQVNVYNTYITRVPASLVAYALDYKVMSWFKAANNAVTVPDMRKLHLPPVTNVE